ncbi:type VI secretion system baseplate subunit TssG [Paraburkholderia fungorum]|uniref:Type VI secretion system baseplate subunit TssG n=1 Tax=Paraburkholderia fungorum TaxID=134537 RepID=A0AAP5QBZ8_9BURK|nr:type VI secretion system baseplate subunit TssG [Paraburkholderia fungorum]MDT8840354.1 type VI secretion system baseplate subunit TssG [Paraburkholderia fungorum]
MTLQEMRNPAPPDLDPLVRSLLTRAPTMSFMQLCQLLEIRVPDQPGFGIRDTTEHEVVRFRPRPRTGFPAGEVASVEFDAGEDTSGSLSASTLPPTVRTTFMGLYGVDAAMPSYMIDDIVLREEGHEALEAFLDQFNHRFVTLLYRAWKKYRYPIGFRPGATDEHSRKLLSLAGFGWGEKPARAGLPDSRVLALLGLLIQRTRTPEGLAGVVALAVPGVEVRVDEFHTTFKAAGKPHVLSSTRSGKDKPDDGAGSNTGTLDAGYVLGTRVAYRGRAVRVTLRPASAEQAHELLPGEPLHRELIAFLRLYIGTKADVFLRMEVSSRLVPPPTMSSTTSGPLPRLAWTTVLPSDDERLITIELGSYEAFPAPAPNPYLAQRVA